VGCDGDMLHVILPRGLRPTMVNSYTGIKSYSYTMSCPSPWRGLTGTKFDTWATVEYG